MVYKNAQIGNTKNIPMIELGNGDVQVGAIFSKEDKYAGLSFMNDKPCKIGTKHNRAGTTTDD